MDRDDGRDSTDRTVKKVVVVIVAVVMLAAANWALEQASVTPWVGLVGAVAVAAVTMSVAGYLSAVARLVDAVAGNRAIQVVAALVALTLVGALVGPALWHRIVTAVGGGPAFAGGCPHPSELRILTSADGLEPARELARSYVRWTADRNDHCPTVYAFVYAAGTSSAAYTALARGWHADDTQHPLVTVGPRPDVWLPDSTVDVRAVRDLARRENLPAPIRASTSIASSPMVLATQAPLSVATDPGATWPQLLSTILDGTQPGLLAPDPETSSAGLLAASGYLSGPGGTLVPLAVARKRERAIIAAGAVAGEGDAALLCRWGRHGAAVTSPRVVVTSDQMWRRFVAGDPLGAGCPGGPPPPSGGHVVPAPAGTPVLDHPFVELAWSTTAQRSGVGAFRQWLSGASGTDALKAVGLRPARHDCSGLENNPCVPTDLGAMLELYRKAQEPGRVLLALDASGSMAAPIGPAGATRFGIASRAVIQALGQMGPKDQLGLWIFPGATGGSRQELASIDQSDGQRREYITNVLRTVHPMGGTPLYDTVIAGMKPVAGAGADTQPRAVVVLTDGRDTASSITAEAAEQAVGNLATTTNVRLFVVATGEASCQGPQGLEKVAGAGLGGCFDANPDQVGATIAQLFDVLWRGQ